ncbi:hypothetical protein SeLEV6574_g06705 [Synchytrium endobioticum]|uniref:TATA-binding protein interacting (TIP20) domain-containing protein n=1 Tax=Synchytrium endobioticum TaxID=286115 RepID=A0A507CMV9_9FUNG|nr:hypothetical protein SeLEV6574_g06705 [Synchytrium endobioticum]
MTQYVIADLLNKMSNTDADYRYMSVNDMMNELNKPNFQCEELVEKKMVNAILKLLEDNIAEVQNVAIKCLGPMVKKIREAQLSDTITKLCDLMQDSKEETKDIASIGLKTVVLEISGASAAAPAIVKKLLVRLITQLRSDTREVSLDTLDIMSEVLSRFSHLITPQDMYPAAHTPLQRSIQDTLLPLLNHSRPAVRKRTTVAIGNLVAHEPDDLFNDLLTNILSELNAKQSAKDADKLRTLVGCVSTISRYSSHRLGTHLSELLPYIISLAAFEDDELREHCLQALESLVLRCPTEMTPHLNTIIGLALQYIKYDPNYDAGTDEEDGMDVDQDGNGDENGNENDDEEMGDGDEDEDDDAGDYSDEDDVSWKVRRASSKLLASIIATRPELLSEMYITVAPALIKRFSEREESVRVDVLSTFIELVKQTGKSCGGISNCALTAAADGGRDSKRRKSEIEPKELLRAQIPKLGTSLSKQLVGKSINTRQTGFALLRELVVVIPGALSNVIGKFIPAIEASLRATGGHHHKAQTNSNLKIETLTFLRILLPSHEPTSIHPYLKKLVNPIVLAAKDKFYKITAEALLVCEQLVRVARPFAKMGSSYIVQPLPQSDFAKYIHTIYTTTMGRLRTDADLEVKERAITCLGAIIYQAGDVLDPTEVRDTVMRLFLDRLKNELTRLVAVKAIQHICESPLLEEGSGASAAAHAISIKPILADVVLETASFLRKSQRPLRVASLQALDSIIGRYASDMTPDLYLAVLTELRPIFQDSDLHILPLAMNTLCTLVSSATIGKSGAADQALAVIRKEVLPDIGKLVWDSPHLVGAGIALDALLNVWSTVVKVGGSPVFSEVVGLLVNPIYNTQHTSGSSKLAYSVIAQSVAILCMNSPADSPKTVAEFVKNISADKQSENVVYLSLLTIGEVGRRTDLSVKHAKLYETLLSLFVNPSEETKHAAAFAMGNVAVGNLNLYMPVILKAVRDGGKKRYLTFVALKEIISRNAQLSASHQGTPLAPFANEVWELLFSNISDTKEEGTRNIIAECLGKLALSDPDRFIKSLQGKLKDTNDLVRATVVTAIRYTFTDEHGGDSYDNLLRPAISDFLQLVKDPSLEVRRVSLTTLNSAAHTKSYLIRESLSTLLPLLYSETTVDETLIHTVEMGPFKHKVDDGLEIRKSAFECMYTLLDTCLSRIEIFGFIDRVMHGLDDPSQEIKALCHLMLQRLVFLSPTALQQRLDDAVEPLKATMNSKPKPNAVKQEIEKLNELIRSGVITTLVLGRLLSTDVAAAGASGSNITAAAATASSTGVSVKFEELLRELKRHDSPLSDVVQQCQPELEQLIASHQQSAGMTSGASMSGILAPSGYVGSTAMDTS